MTTQSSDARVGTQPAPSVNRHADSRSAFVRAAGAALAASAVVSALLVSFPTPWLSSLLALALLVLAPTSSRIDRRLALNLALVAGWVPVALLLPPVLGPRTAAISTLSVATGISTAVWVARRSRLLPTARTRDAALLVAGAAAGLIAFPLRSPGSPDRALAMLSTGIDNAYHFAMYLEQRLAASGSTLLAANADDSGFGFSSYPQWFHKMLTVVAQVVFGDAGDSPHELVRYAQLQWLVFVAVVVMVTAAFLQSLPRRVPASLLVPALAVTWSLVLGVPGALNLIQGHLGFLLAASAPVVIFLLARPARPPSATVFATMCGLVLVSASWMLLLPLAAAAIVPPTLVMWRRQGTVVRWSTLAAAGVGTAVAALVVVFPWLFGAGLQAVVRDGTIPRVGLPTLVPLLLGCWTVLVLLRRRHPGSGLAPHLLVSGVAAAQLVVLGGYMLLTTGELTYYFWKLALGSLLAAIVVTTHAVVSVRLAAAESQGRSAAVRPLVAALVTLVAAAGLGSALQEFTAPSAAWAALLPSSLSSRVTSDAAGDVDTVLKLAETTEPHDAARVRLLATRPDDMNAAHASEWFHALSHSATWNAVSVDDPVYVLAKDRGDLALATDIATDTLRIPGRRIVITDTALYRSVLSSVTPEDAERVSLLPTTTTETHP